MKRTNYIGKKAVVRRGFTHIELLVVIVVIGMLAMLGISVSARLRNQTNIAQCSANVRELNMAMLLSAADNQDTLPQLVGGASWVWDIPVFATDSIMRYGVTPKTMYCPSTAPRFTDKQNFANTSPMYGNNSSLWNFGISGPTPGNGDFHVIGYTLALWGQNSILQPTNQNRTVNPEAYNYYGVRPPERPSQRVLTADAILSLSINSGFTSIGGGFQQQGVTYPYISPHLDGIVPAGGNVGMLDGHVEWRPFSQMVPRNGGYPYFYF